MLKKKFYARYISHHDFAFCERCCQKNQMLLQLPVPHRYKNGQVEVDHRFVQQYSEFVKDCFYEVSHCPENMFRINLRDKDVFGQVGFVTSSVSDDWLSDDFLKKYESLDCKAIIPLCPNCMEQMINGYWKLLDCEQRLNAWYSYSYFAICPGCYVCKTIQIREYTLDWCSRCVIDHCGDMPDCDSCIYSYSKLQNHVSDSEIRLRVAAIESGSGFLVVDESGY